MRTNFAKLIERKASLGLLWVFLFCGFNSFAQPGHTCAEAISLSTGNCGVYDNTFVPGTMGASCFTGLIKSMWFSFVADSAGAIITVDGGNPQTMGRSSVAIFSNTGGCGGTFTELAGGCNNPNNNNSLINDSNLIIGNTYYVLVDGRGSVGSFNICLNLYSPEPIAPLSIISVTHTGVSFCGANDGAISLVASGGTGTYQYSINGGSNFFSNGGNFTGLSTGNYPIAIFDGNQIVTGSTLVIADPGPPTVPIAGTNASYCEGATMANLTATAGSGGTLTWYSDAALTTIIGTGTTLTPLTTLGVTNYYVSESLGTCQSSSSIVTISINAVVTNSISATICFGNTYTLGTQTLNSTGTYNETFVSADGCDSVVTLNLTVTPVITNSISATICSGNTYTFGTQTLNANGTYNETFISASGCDSVVTLNLTVTPVITNSISATICSGNTYTFGTQTLNASGTYNEPFVSAGGCDLIVTLNLFVTPAITNSISASICSGNTYTLGTQTLNSTGIYNETFVSTGGCDSIVTLNLTVTPVITNSISVTICSGATYTLGTQILNSTGTYNETFVSVSGCDSIVTLSLSVDPIPVANAGEDIEICKGKEITLNGSGGTNYSWLPLGEINNANTSSPTVHPSASTTYTITVSTITGCSSADSVNVSVKTDGDCIFHVYANFTPNKDNINDSWIIDGVDLYNVIKISIYNRWGDEVWESESYNNTTNVWMGQNKKSEDLPDGIYFYVIKADNDSYNGTVEINR